MEGLREVDSRSLLVFRDCDIIYFMVLDARGGVTPAIVNGGVACLRPRGKVASPQSVSSSIGESDATLFAIRGAEAGSINADRPPLLFHGACRVIYCGFDIVFALPYDSDNIQTAQIGVLVLRTGSFMLPVITRLEVWGEHQS
jgi:hypothetical protein